MWVLILPIDQGDGGRDGGYNLMMVAMSCANQWSLGGGCDRRGEIGCPLVYGRPGSLTVAQATDSQARAVWMALMVAGSSGLQAGGLQQAD